MGIINCYDDMDMVLSNFSEDDIRRFVSGREFALVQIDADVIRNHHRTKGGMKFYPKYLLLRMSFNDYSLLIDDGDESNGRTYLCIRKTLPRFRQVEGVIVSYPTMEELLQRVLGKHLVYYADFAEDRCGVDQVINKHLQKDIFDLRKKGEYYL